ncbi:MAG: glycosyltransferase family 9 protein [Candidatus Kapabacteria bacterium]|nr:glycosyltransferase family 9 protein [Candidatus Kapabacteria bacterium]
MKDKREFFFNSKKIAIVRTDKLGDMVLTLPMAKAIKETFPDKYITLISSKYTKPLLENLKCIDKKFFLEDFNDGINGIFNNEKFDVVFFPRPRFNECLSAFLTGQKLRVGSAYRWYSFLFNFKIYSHRKTAEMHEAEYNVNMIENLTEKKLKTELVKPNINDSDKRTIETLLKKHNLTPENFIIIHPGSGGSAYEWKAENFGSLAKKIFERTGLKIVITGNKLDEPKCNIVSIISETSINLCSQLTLEELITLISFSKLLVANSTGVVHIAAALGIKVLGLYPNSPHLSPKRWGPYSKDSVCVTPDSKGKNNQDDMNLINFDKVLFTAIELIEK